MSTNNKLEFDVNSTIKKNTDDNNYGENYYNELENYYANHISQNDNNPNNVLQNLQNDILRRFYNVRQNNVKLNGVHSLLTQEAMCTKYYHNEFTPATANNVFSTEIGILINEYYHELIDNNTFNFADAMSQRWYGNNDFLSRIIHFELLPLIEHMTQRRLKPTYSYLSCYVKGAVLPPHTDRAECEFSVSFIIDKPEGAQWPIYVDPIKQPVRLQTYPDFAINEKIDKCIPMDCDPNGLILFSGTDHIHFREELKEEYYYVMLLHYVSY